MFSPSSKTAVLFFVNFGGRGWELRISGFLNLKKHRAKDRLDGGRVSVGS